MNLRELRERLAICQQHQGNQVTLLVHEAAALIAELDRLATALQLTREEASQRHAYIQHGEIKDFHEDTELLDWLERSHASTWAARLADLDGNHLKPAQWTHGVRRHDDGVYLSRPTLREAIREIREIRPSLHKEPI